MLGRTHEVERRVVEILDFGLPIAGNPKSQI